MDNNQVNIRMDKKVTAEYKKAHFKYFLMSSLFLSLIATTTVISCTRKSDDRELKGKVDTAAGKPDSAKPGATAAAAADMIRGAGPSVTADTSVGFKTIKSLKDEEKTKVAKDSILIIKTATTNSGSNDTKIQADTLATALQLDSAKISLSEIKSKLSEKMDALLKEEKNESKHIIEINRDFKISKSNINSIILQLAECADKKVEVKNCILYALTNKQTAFAIAGNEILTSIDFLKDYFDVYLKNNSAYKDLTKDEDKLSFLLSLPKLSIQAAQISIDGKHSEITDGVKISKMSLEVIKFLESDKPVSIPLSARVVQLKLVNKGLDSLKPLIKSEVDCSKVAQTSLVGAANQATTNRLELVKKLDKNSSFGEAVARQINVSAGKAIALKTAKEKASKILSDIDPSVEASKIVVTTNDKVDGMIGGPLVDASTGKYLGVYVGEEVGLAIGSCVAP